MNAGILKSCDFYRNRLKMSLFWKWENMYIFVRHENILVCCCHSIPEKSRKKNEKNRYPLSTKMSWIVDTRPGKKFVPLLQSWRHYIIHESIKNYIFSGSERHAYRLVYTLAQVAFSSFIFEAFFSQTNLYTYYIFFHRKKKLYCMHKVLYPSNNANKPIRRKPISACTILTK